MVTIKEIAKKCNVSISTVSNIINNKPKVGEETRQRVLKAIEEMEYQPNYIAQGLRNQKSKIIGIIAEDITQFSTPAMIESIMAYFEERGYKVIMENLRFYARWQGQWQNKDKEYKSILNAALQELLSIKVEGIIYIACHARVINCFPEDLHVPGVVAYAYSECPRFPSIIINDEKNGYDVTKYLITMGHRKIGVLGGQQNNVHTQKRLLGYQRALFEEEILYNPGWICYGDWKKASGYEWAKHLINQEVTAIFGLTDIMTWGIYDYMEECGLKVGEDISLFSCDNTASVYFKPALSTMQLPLFEIGRCSAEILIDMIEGDCEKYPPGTEIELECSMILRDSVKKIENK